MRAIKGRDRAKDITTRDQHHNKIDTLPLRLRKTTQLTSNQPKPKGEKNTQRKHNNTKAKHSRPIIVICIYLVQTAIVEGVLTFKRNCNMHICDGTSCLSKKKKTSGRVQNNRTLRIEHQH